MEFIVGQDGRKLIIRRQDIHIGNLTIASVEELDVESLSSEMKLAKPPKPKTCKECKAKFTPSRPLQVCCSPKCAIERATKQRKTKEKKEYRATKERIKSRGDYAREAQIAFNAYIRARDEGKPCISCGSHTGKKNAGHYRSVGSCPELRFEESQVHLQCEKCNSYLSGNLINYRAALILRVGIEQVEWIEGKHEAKHYSIDDLKSIKEIYRSKLKALK